MSLAGACGDDTDIIATGGMGGSAGLGGTGGGRAGGLGGGAGTDECNHPPPVALHCTPPPGGSAGTDAGGSAGTDAGGSGGAAGGEGGTGGDEPPDAGSFEPLDAGGLCPAGFDDLVSGPTAGAHTDNATQEVIITRIVFDGDDIQVTFRGAIPTGFNFSSPLVLCTGSEFSDCDGGAVGEVQGSGSGDGGVGNLLPTEEQTYVFRDALVGTSTTAESGELALVNGLDPNSLLFTDHAFVRAYVSWGNYESQDPSGPFDAATAFPNLEERAFADGVWTLGDSIEVGSDDTIYATDEVTSASGFQTCTQP